jgi:hypothetical protein
MASVKKRDITGVWFFTYSDIDKEKISALWNIENRIVFWDVDYILDKEIYMWFLLYIEEWYISLLEWYTFTWEFNDVDIKDYELSYSWRNRVIPDSLK